MTFCLLSNRNLLDIPFAKRQAFTEKDEEEYIVHTSISIHGSRTWLFLHIIRVGGETILDHLEVFI